MNMWVTVTSSKWPKKRSTQLKVPQNGQTKNWLCHAWIRRVQYIERYTVKLKHCCLSLFSLFLPPSIKMSVKQTHSKTPVCYEAGLPIRQLRNRMFHSTLHATACTCARMELWQHLRRTLELFMCSAHFVSDSFSNFGQYHADLLSIWHWRDWSKEQFHLY